MWWTAFVFLVSSFSFAGLQTPVQNTPPTLTQATAWPPASSLCRDARLTDLYIKGVKGYNDKLNFCSVQAKETPPEIQSMINDIGLLHAKVASLLNVSIENLFPTSRGGVALSLWANDEDFFGSLFDYQQIVMGVSSHWHGGLNMGIYTHELGHLLTYFTELYSNEALPLSFSMATDSEILSETIADSLALGIYGRVISPDSTFPDCLMKIRHVTAAQTYNSARGYYLGEFTAQRTVMCCANALKQKNVNEDTKQYCSSTLGAKTLPFDKTRFDPADFVAEIKKLIESPPQSYESVYDAHQIGIPLNSFMLDLAKRTKQNLWALFFKALATNTDKINPTLICKSTTGSGESVEIRSFSLGAAFESLRHIFNDDVTFKKAWNLHRIDMAVAMSDGEYKLRAPLRAKNYTGNPMVCQSKE